MGSQTVRIISEQSWLQVGTELPIVPEQSPKPWSLLEATIHCSTRGADDDDDGSQLSTYIPHIYQL